MTAYKVFHGGLMRCCLATLDEAMQAATEPPEEGDTLQCKFCSESSGMIFRGGAWRWNQAPIPPFIPSRPA